MLSTHAQAQQGSHQLWTVDGSKQGVLGQSQAASDMGLIQSLCRPPPSTWKQTQRGGHHGETHPPKKNWPQMKAQENSAEEELSEAEASNLSDIEFKVMIVSMLSSVKKTDKP